MRRYYNKKILISFVLILVSILSLFNYSDTIVTKNKEKMANTYMKFDSNGFTCTPNQVIRVSVQGSSAVKTIKSDNTKIATVKESGTQPRCLNCRAYDITCKSKGNAVINATGTDGAKAKLKVNVSNTSAASKYVNLNKTKVTCEKGKSVTLTASLSSVLSNLSTGDKTIATISKDPSVTLRCPNCYQLVIKCLKKGSTTFSVKGKDGAKATGNITVNAAAQTDSIKVDKSSVNCTVGKSVIVRATGTYSKASSSDKKIAKVAKNPNNDSNCTGSKCTSLQISCLKVGKATVTVESKGGKKATVSVNVSKKNNTQKDPVQFDKKSYVCDMSKSKSFVINVTTKNDSITKIESSDTFVATVKLGKKTSSSGVSKYSATVTCLQDGNVKITATDNTNSKSTVDLSIKNGGVVDIPRNINCKVGEKKIINVNAYSANVETGIKGYSTGDKSIATVSRNNSIGMYCVGCVALNVNCLKEGKTTLSVKSSTGAVGKSKITVNSDKIPNQVKFNSSNYKCDVSKGSKTITTYVTAGIDKITEVKSTNSNIASVTFSEIKQVSGTTDRVYEVKITCKKFGSTRIKAKSEKNVEGSAKVKVTNEENTKKDKVTFDKTSYSCQKGKTINVTATATLSSVKSIKSSDAKIAKVIGEMAVATQNYGEVLTIQNAQYIREDNQKLNSFLATSNCASATSEYLSNDNKGYGVASNCISMSSSNSLTTSIECIKNGTVTLTATSAYGAKATTKLTVKTTLSKAKVSFSKKYTCTPGATISGLITITDATNTQNSQEEIKKVTSSNENVAKISLDGAGYYSKSKPTERYQKIKINCIKAGTATLKATTNLGVSGSGSVTVSESSTTTESSIKFDKDSYDCTVGKTSSVVITTTGTTLQNAFSNNFMIGYLAYQGSSGGTKHTFKMNCLKAGTTTLTAVAKDGKTATAKLVSKKQDPVPVKSITFESNPIKCKTGKTIISKIVTTGGEKVKSVSSSNNNIASINLENNFTYTTSNSYAVLIKCLKAGDAVFTATGESGTSATAKVNVTENVQSISVTKVELNKTSISLSVGKTTTLKATITPSNATNKTITWSSSNSAVASVDNSGKVTAVSVGNATITAKAASGVKATAKVTVTGASGNETVTVNPSSINMKVGQTKQVEVKVKSNDSSVISKIGGSKSNNTSIATVYDNPNLQVNCIDCRLYEVKCISKGSTTITYSSAQGTKKDQKVTCTSANEIPVTKVELEDLPYHLTVSYGASINVDIQPSNATNKKIAWSSSNPNVANVRDNIVWAVGVGEATITAKSSNGKKDTLKVYVTKNAPKYMDLDTTSISCKVGGEKTVIAQGTSKITSYKSKNSKIAKIEKHPYLVVVGDGHTAAYRVRCLKSGSTTIEVKGADGSKGTASVKVS